MSNPPMSIAEKFLKRLGDFRRQLVFVVTYIGPDGQPVIWGVLGFARVEGVLGIGGVEAAERTNAHLPADYVAELDKLSQPEKERLYSIRPEAIINTANLSAPPAREQLEAVVREVTDAQPSANGKRKKAT